VPNDRLVSWVNLRMDLFVQLLQYFQLLFLSVVYAFFAQNTTCFQKHVYAFVDFLGKLLVSALKVRIQLLKFLKNSRCSPFSSLSPFIVK
jgi:hypothetical protein